MSDAEVKKLKRKRTTERTDATRFITTINDFTGDNPLDDYKQYIGRLQQTLDQLVRLDDSIQDLLDDNEYTADVEVCGEYLDSAKRAILKAKQEIGRRLVSSAPNHSTSELTTAPRQIDHL
jgi:hypothetical protein